MKTQNPIERVAPYLFEVGQPIMKQVEAIEAIETDIDDLQRDLAYEIDRLEKARAELLRCIRVDWTDSEIETADVLCNRYSFTAYAERNHHA